MARRRRLLVPESREALEKLKAQVVSRELGRPVSSDEVKYEVAKRVGVPLLRGYNGQLNTKSAGKVGGEIGGQMVKELVHLAQKKLVDDEQTQR